MENKQIDLSQFILPDSHFDRVREALLVSAIVDDEIIQSHVIEPEEFHPTVIRIGQQTGIDFREIIKVMRENGIDPDQVVLVEPKRDWDFVAPLSFDISDMKWDCEKLIEEGEHKRKKPFMFKSPQWNF